MKTIKQIADGLGIDKQRVYRYIRKNHISEAHHDVGVMWYDDVAETLIKQGLIEIERVSDAHQTTSNDTVIDTVISVLQAELKSKNELILAQQKTIGELASALESTTAGLRAAQMLHAGTIQEKLLPSVTSEKPKKRFWDILGKR